MTGWPSYSPAVRRPGHLGGGHVPAARVGEGVGQDVSLVEQPAERFRGRSRHRSRTAPCARTSRTAGAAPRARRRRRTGRRRTATSSTARRPRRPGPRRCRDQVAQVVPARPGPLRHDVQLTAVAPGAIAQIQRDLGPAGRAGQRGHRVAGVVLRYRPEIRHLRQRHRQHVIGQRDRPGRVGLVVDDGERLAPVALPGEQPVLQVVGAAARADPVPLQALDVLRPVHLVQVGQQPLGERGDAQHPLPQRPAVHRVVADRAAALGGHLLVGQHGAQPRAPVDDLLRQVGQPVRVDGVGPLARGQIRPGPAVRGGALARGELGDQVADRARPVSRRVVPAVEDAQEDPLRPAVVGGVAGHDLAPAVVRQTQPAQLAAHDGGVLPDGDGRVLAGVDRVLLGGQPEGVEAERVQHVMAGHAQVAAEHVGADIAQRMPHVQPDAAGVREEVQQVELDPPGFAPVLRVEGALPFPALLPAQLDLAGQPCVVPERRLVLSHGFSLDPQERKSPSRMRGCRADGSGVSAARREAGLPRRT